MFELLIMDPLEGGASEEIMSMAWTSAFHSLVLTSYVCFLNAGEMWSVSFLSCL